MRYYRAETTADAVEALASGGAGARVLVGGTDLLVAMRHGKVEPTLLVDIKHVTDLPDPVAIADDGVTIAATATMAMVAAHPRLVSWYPALVESALKVGSVAIRNRASLVANSCNGSPAADTAPALLAHDAWLTIASTHGRRTTRLADFFLGPRRTLCAPGELVVSLHLPRPPLGSASAFQRMTRRRGVDLATVSVAAVADRGGRFTLGLGAVGPVPLRTGPSDPIDVEAETELDAAVDQLLAVATPISDVRAGEDYRRAMLRVLTKRAMRTAAQRRESGRANR